MYTQLHAHPSTHGYTIILFTLWFLVSVLPNLKADPVNLPDMAGSAESLFTPVEEQRLGREFMRSVRNSVPIIDDQLLSDYINALGQRLVSMTDSGARHFYFFLIDQPDINAFAGPDGNIGVYSGLVLASESESELAAVLAHEISHVTQNHLTRAFEDASNMSAPAMALLLAALVLGAKAGNNAGIAAAMGVQAAALQHQINFTRENEQEADTVGIKLLAAANFDPHAMPGFFERLSKASRLYENNAPEFLLTHPVTTNRIADAMGRADAYPYRQHLDEPEYFLTRAALRERTFTNPKQAVDYFRATLTTKRYRQETGEHYGYALALLRSHQIGAARQEVQQLLKQNPTSIPFLLLDAKVDAAAHQTAHAVNSIATAMELFPGNAALASYYAQLSLAQGQPAKAARPLDQTLANHHNEPNLYELRARVAEAAGQRADACLFLAEASVLKGEVESAVQQLGSALRTEHFDDYATLKIRSRLEELERELKADKASEKSGSDRDKITSNVNLLHN